MPQLRQMSALTCNAGCPALARSLRKSGIPRKSHAWDFLKLGFLLAAIALLSACRLDMHVQPRQNPLSRSDFFCRPALRASAGRGHGRARPAARRHLFLHGKARQQSRRLHAVSRDQGSSRTRTRALQHLLRSLSLRGRRRQRFHPVARFRAQAAVVSHPATAESSTRLLLRRNHATASASCPTTPRRFRRKTAGTSWPTSARCS